MTEQEVVKVKKGNLLTLSLEELKGKNRILIGIYKKGLTTYEFLVFDKPVAKYIRKSFTEEANLNKDEKVTAEEAFEYPQPWALLEMIIGLGCLLVIVEIIKAWIKGEATFFKVIYILSVIDLALPIHQMFDCNLSSEIFVT